MKRIIAFLVLAAGLIAADLTGEWTAAVVLQAGSGNATFVFKQTGDKLTGTYTGTLGASELTGTVKGDTAEWTFEVDQVGTATYKATMDGASKMKGTVVYGQLGGGTFTAAKK